MAPGTKAALEATNDAFGDTLGEIFDIPETDLDNQMARMAAGEEATYMTSSEAGTITNATENDNPGDQALIDLVPVPSDNQTPDASDISDPFDGIFG